MEPGSGRRSIEAYDRAERAAAYHAAGGFDPRRKRAMLEAALAPLLDLTPRGCDLLELGAGTGLFTRAILATDHFRAVHATDGAPAMLDVARRELGSDARLRLDLLDFTAPSWGKRWAGRGIAAVASSMAVHHAPDKRAVFSEVHAVLEPGGVFVLADHLAGASPAVDGVIGRARARIRLQAEGTDPSDPAAVAAFMDRDARAQAAEGNRCASAASYLRQLEDAGFTDVDCLWRDLWLAVFVARKPAG